MWDNFLARAEIERMRGWDGEGARERGQALVFKCVCMCAYAACVCRYEGAYHKGIRQGSGIYTYGSSKHGNQGTWMFLLRQPTDVTLLILSEGRASVDPINAKTLHVLVQIISKPPINCRNRKFHS